MKKKKVRIPKFEASELIQSAAEQIGAALRQKLISHPGELGTGREEVIREFLRQFLPQSFGVSTGFIVDAHGSVSQQIDVIVYNKLTCPQFEAVGGKKFFPCESVVCVGGIRSSLTSKQTAKQAFDNLLSVKKLDRSAGGRNFALINDKPIDQEANHLDQVFAFLFITDKCLSEDGMRRALFEYICEHERHLWPNLCYHFDRYLLTYGCESGFCPNPMDAFAISSVNFESGKDLLITFGRLVAGASYVTRVSSFSYWEYLSGPDYARMYAFEDEPVHKRLPQHMLLTPGSGSFKA
jgi:hypothetical protein